MVGRRSGAGASGSPHGDRRPVRAAIVGATGYVGGELIRLLGRHPSIELVGLVARDRDGVPVGTTHPHLAGTGLTIGSAVPDVDVALVALPHGASAAIVPDLVARGIAVVDLGADFRLKDPASYAHWYGPVSYTHLRAHET